MGVGWVKTLCSQSLRLALFGLREGSFHKRTWGSQHPWPNELCPSRNLISQAKITIIDYPAEQRRAVFANSEAENRLRTSQPTSLPWGVISRAPGASLPLHPSPRARVVGPGRRHDGVEDGGTPVFIPEMQGRPHLGQPVLVWLTPGVWLGHSSRGSKRELLPFHRMRCGGELLYPGDSVPQQRTRRGQGISWPEALGKQAGPSWATNCGGIRLSRPSR